MPYSYQALQSIGDIQNRGIRTGLIGAAAVVGGIALGALESLPRDLDRLGSASVAHWLESRALSNRAAASPVAKRPASARGGSAVSLVHVCLGNGSPTTADWPRRVGARKPVRV